ncbi:hypothetical protein RF11_06370 [Thelohanellus kitauei]|uniref:Uncharacterized protein n=1 Tax=Thelohanellus kitauei TaxID=669202 RepID=A0A0C2IG74_THEKT|nr:hypothetical protein RF11_06370 [Thelohanellus kitauei]
MNHQLSCSCTLLGVDHIDRACVSFVAIDSPGSVLFVFSDMDFPSMVRCELVCTMDSHGNNLHGFICIHLYDPLYSSFTKEYFTSIFLLNVTSRVFYTCLQLLSDQNNDYISLLQRADFKT